MPQPAILVFDDYQNIPPNSAVHELVATAAERLPADIQLIVLSREPPPPAFARLRVHATISTVTAESMRFTIEETEALAKLTSLSAAAAEHVTALHTATEGWAAGLTLLLERGDQPLPAKLPSATDPGVLFDYFSSEIFDQLDPAAATVLLECSLLPEMEARTLQALANGDQAAALLDELCSRNYFTTRAESETAVYRFHPLFRTFLNVMVRRNLTPQRLSALQHRAAEILLAGGDVENAITLLHACEDWQQLSQTLLEHAEAFAQQGRFKTLESWIHMLPDEITGQNPWILFWLGTCRLPFEPTAAHPVLLEAYRLFELRDDATGLHLAWATIATLYFFALFSSTDAVAWIVEFDALQKKHPRFSSAAVEARVAISIVALLRLYRLDHPALPSWVDRCRALLPTMEDRSMRLMAVNELGWCYSWLGKTEQGALLVKETAHLATGDVPPLARLSWLLASMIYAWHRADDIQCSARADEAFCIADENDIHVVDTYLCAMGSYGALAVGNIAAAKKLRARLDAASGHVARRNMEASAYYHVHTLVSLHSGQFDAAAEYAREAWNQASEFQITFLRFLTSLTLAACLLEQGDLDQAEHYLETGFNVVSAVDSDVLVHLHLLGKALIEFKRGRIESALELLSSALQSARSVGGHYTPFFFRPSLAALYAAGLEHGIDVELIQNQVTRQRLVPPDAGNAPKSWPWPIRVFTLGRFSVTKDGLTLNTGANASRKPAQLLKTLIACGGRNVHQDTLTCELWPDADGDAAHHALETTLYRLRKLLGPDAIAVKNGVVTLTAEHCWVDCWALERALSTIDLAIAADDAVRVSNAADHALSLYHGPFLDFEPEITLAARHRERLRSRLARSLDSLVSYWTGKAEYDKPLEHYLQALETDPCAERLHCQLMRFYQTRRCYPEAVAAFERCRQSLLSHAGREPGTETQAIHAEVLAAIS